jgi:hypothetical protein
LAAREDAARLANRSCFTYALAQALDAERTRAENDNSSPARDVGSRKILGFVSSRVT